MKGVEYLDITGVQSFSYISRELLSGELSNYYPYQDRRYSLDLNIRGKFEAGTAIEGYFKKSSRIEDNDYINIKLFSNHWDCEFGNMDNISSNDFYKNNKVIAVKGRVFNDKHLVEGGFGTPEGVYHFVYIEGDNTQGPYQLLNLPIISMTEIIFIIEDGSKTQLMNGKDYNIDYRTGRITLNFILTDDKGLEIEYYSQNWTSLNRVDYTVGSKSQFGIFSFGLNGGGVYFRGDSIGDSLNNYFSFGANAGIKFLSIMNIDMQAMSSVEKADSGYELSGTGLAGNGNITYKILSLSANAYKSFNDFKRIGEFNNKEYTTIDLNGNIAPLKWVLLTGDYSKHISDNTNSRTMGGKGKLSKDAWGSLEGGYSENYNYINTGTNTEYSGYNAMYSNTIWKFDYYIKGNTGINSSINDTIINEYKKHNIGIGNTSKINDNAGLSFDALVENRQFQDSINNIYELRGNGYYKYLKIVNYSLSANYMRKNSMNLYSGTNSIIFNLNKYLNINSKIKADVNRRYSYTDSIEPEIKYNINNSLNSNPFRFMKIRLSNAMVLSQGLISDFLYQRNISNSGNMSMSFVLFQWNIDGGNGLFINYSNTGNNELQSNNKRYYINSNISIKEISGYKIKVFGKYSTNDGLTMQYIPISYTEQIDTVSNLISQNDYELGTDITRTYTFGKATAGYSFIRNYKGMPDSIPIDAYSNRGYIDAKRNIVDGLDITLKVTGEKRKGIDPDIDRTDDYMDVLIISPEAGIFYSLMGYGNVGVIYNTAFYSGTSNQRRHKIGFNMNIRKGYFEVSGSGNYCISDYYKTLEYNVGLNIRF